MRIVAATNRDLESMMRAGTFREDLYYRLQVIEVHVPPLRERLDEIPALVEFFVVKYSSLYRRPATRPSRLLLDALAGYSWPGNIRELENVVKRFVVLQDEALVLLELARLRQMPPHALGSSQPPAAAPPAPSREMPPAAPSHAATAAAAAGEPAAATATAVAVGPEETGSAPGASVELPESEDLQLLAKTAAMRAEREAIERALQRFRWNRRRAAKYLNVSYKTLLNKIKECGINESHDAANAAAP